MGLAWSGSPTHLNDRHRSCRLRDFAPLLDVPDVAFYSLQVGPRAGEVHDLGRSGPAVVADLSDRLGDFADTAAAIEQLDLTISVDTSVLHLAGALGRPAWGMISARSDWRWMIDREDSPWYPTIRLFRQSRLDDWAEVFAPARRPNSRSGLTGTALAISIAAPKISKDSESSRQTERGT